MLKYNLKGGLSSTKLNFTPISTSKGTPRAHISSNSFTQFALQIPKSFSSAAFASLIVTTRTNLFSSSCLFGFGKTQSLRFFSLDESSHSDFKTVYKQAPLTDKEKGEVRKFIEETISSSPVVIFMKGVPDAPRCGFSGLAVSILREEGVTDFKAVNVLEDDDIRQGIKEYTNWNTIPQIFINKEFLGGCDILKELYQSGELTQILKKSGAKLNK